MDNIISRGGANSVSIVGRFSTLQECPLSEVPLYLQMNARNVCSWL